MNPGDPLREHAQLVNAGDEKPLVFKKWRSWYMLLIAVLAAIILLLSWITQVFR